MRTNEVVVKCACCGKESKQKQICDCVAKGYMDLDTRPPEERRSALELEIQECPECHYCSEDISAPASESDKAEINSDTYKSILADTETDSVARKFLLAGYLCQKAEKTRPAGLNMLRMAWRFDDLKDDSSAKDAREMAAAFYKEANEAAYDEGTALLLVDLMRRTGDFWNATTAIEEAYRKSETPLISSLLVYERQLVVRRDSSAHNIGERSDAGN